MVISETIPALFKSSFSVYLLSKCFLFVDAEDMLCHGKEKCKQSREIIISENGYNVNANRGKPGLKFSAKQSIFPDI